MVARLDFLVSVPGTLFIIDSIHPVLIISQRHQQLYNVSFRKGVDSNFAGTGCPHLQCLPWCLRKVRLALYGRPPGSRYKPETQPEQVGTQGY